MNVEIAEPRAAGPVTSLRRRRRVRPLAQAEIAECGLACLAMVAGYWGKKIDLAELRLRHPVTMRGMGLSELIKTASSLQFSSRPLKVGIDRIGEMSFPAILHWDLNHFVVAERFSGDRLYIVDPAHGTGAWHDRTSLDRHFTGIVLELEPGESFAPETIKRELRLTELWGRTEGLVGTIGQAVLLSLILQLFVLVSPYFLQIAVDEAIPAADTNLLVTLAIGFALFAVITGAAHAMRGYVLLSAGTMLAYAMSTNLARHMLRLPIFWFERRSVGDILSRFQSVQPLRQLLTEGMAVALLDGLMAIITLAAMMLYSPVLTAIPIVSLLAYVALRAFTLSAERATEGEAIIALAREQSAMIETLRGMTTIRLAGREALRQAAWQNRLTDLLSERYAHEKITATQQAGGHLLEAFEMVLVVWLGAVFVIDGGFSIGMLFAFATWRLQFSSAARRVVDQGAAWRKAKLHLERLTDIAFAPEDPGFSEPESRREPMKGGIELRGVAHRYGQYEPFVLQGIDLLIEPGEHLVITGPSGSGKSTLIKILLGLLEPSEGEVLVDGQTIARFGRRAYRAQVGAVLQEDTLFTGSIADNVAGFTGTDRVRVQAALRDAAILDDIEQMPMRENTLVGDMGSTLSGGQKQRILLARAFYREPRLLVLDEGTSALDVAHEQRINERIARMGITRIGVAHRRETIEAARRVVTIQNGTIHSDHVLKPLGQDATT